MEFDDCCSERRQPAQVTCAPIGLPYSVLGGEGARVESRHSVQGITKGYVAQVCLLAPGGQGGKRHRDSTRALQSWRDSSI